MPGEEVEARPFRVAVSDEAIADLQSRLDRTRWPGQPRGAGWELGTDSPYLAELCAYWRDGYDWDGFDRRLNTFPQFHADIGGQPLHFYHHRSPDAQARPLLLCHGWPSSAAEFLKVMGPLSEGAGGIAFHVIAPSIPGFGFSGPTTDLVGSAEVANRYHRLMLALGYENYFVHGGDKGVLIAMLLAASVPERVRAIHLTMVPAPAPDCDARAALSETERRFLARADEIASTGMAYQHLHRTRPQTLAHALADSPAGLASWLVEKYRAWTDCGGDLESRLSWDELLDIVNIYWLTNTIASSIRIYHADHGPGRAAPLPKVTVPVGHSHFPAEIIYTPRDWAAHRYDIAYWKEMPEGGHFPALEVPQLFVGEMRDFFGGFTSP